VIPAGLVFGADVAALLGESTRGAIDPLAWLDAGSTRRMDRAGKLSTAVIGKALEDADARGASPVERASASALSGTAFGCVDGSMRFMKRVIERGATMASPADFPNLVPSSPVSHASIHWRLGGPAIATPDLSATAESAVATGIELLEAGVCPAAIAGSVEEVSQLTERVLAPLLGMRRMSAASDGASAIVLESTASARARGARPLAKIRLLAAFRGDGREIVARSLQAIPHPGARDVLVSEKMVDPVRLLRDTPWCEARRLTLGEAAGDHVGCGGVALAAAAALVGTREIDRALFIGEAPERGYVFLLEAAG
jgi:3-oxoacyl-[acyl-carrier-protein] synthase II